MLNIFQKIDDIMSRKTWQYDGNLLFECEFERPCFFNLEFINLTAVLEKHANGLTFYSSLAANTTLPSL